jgi:hypothetical protein
VATADIHAEPDGIFKSGPVPFDLRLALRGVIAAD